MPEVPNFIAWLCLAILVTAALMWNNCDRQR
jgi:hypothetical protein